jgi:hypothetical protein
LDELPKAFETNLMASVEEKEKRGLKTENEPPVMPHLQEALGWKQFVRERDRNQGAQLKCHNIRRKPDDTVPQDYQEEMAREV